MRILGADYTKKGELLTVCIVDKVDDCMKVINVA